MAESATEYSNSAIIKIAHQSWIPLRKEPSSASEMVSCLLFGEKAEVLSQQDDWLEVRCLHDQYMGYIPVSYFETALSIDWHSDVRLLSGLSSIELNHQPYLLSPGSKIPSNSSGHLHNFTEINNWVDFCYQYLNTPYLWGGRSIFGIDCSGFTQVYAEYRGIALPRDAYQQAEIGDRVDFGDQKPGDLAFFQNSSGKITHVGILLDEHKIIHASGKVRIDKFTIDGIQHAENHSLTHVLAGIKRCFTDV